MADFMSYQYCRTRFPSGAGTRLGGGEVRGRFIAQSAPLRLLFDTARRKTPFSGLVVSSGIYAIREDRENGAQQYGKARALCAIIKVKVVAARLTRLPACKPSPAR